MKDLTYLLPCRIETDDRLRNVITSVSYLLKNFPEAKVLVKEVDTKSQFIEFALPQIKKYAGDIGQLKHSFEKSDEKFFHKTRILNDLCVAADTPIIYNHDVDVVLPKNSHELAYQGITQEGSDAVYPFGCGIYQWAVNYSDDLLDKFLSSHDGTDFDLSVLDNSKQRIPSSIGWGQMIKKAAQVSAGMWNEEFISWGAEDVERYTRFVKSNAGVARCEGGYVFHLEHPRGADSSWKNPNFMNNEHLWTKLQAMDGPELIEYYKNCQYIKKYGWKLGEIE